MIKGQIDPFLLTDIHATYTTGEGILIPDTALYLISAGAGVENFVKNDDPDPIELN
jgi:hypothetical protein